MTDDDESAWLARIPIEERQAWLKQAERPGNPAAWNGVDRCDRPARGRAKCAFADQPHRHCACGVALSLDYGYCDECINALLRGAAMTSRESAGMRKQREAWLEKFGFIIPSLERTLKDVL